jgi:hypothetical protein
LTGRSYFDWEDIVKRIRLLVLLGAVAIALPFGISAVGATDTPPANSVSIREYAQFSTGGTYIEVGGTVRCHGGGTRIVEVFVKQKYPETPHIQGATGIGTQFVVCDGSTRSWAATVPPGLFDAGRAWAKATLDPLSPTATAQRWITIVQA